MDEMLAGETSEMRAKTEQLILTHKCVRRLTHIPIYATAHSFIRSLSPSLSLSHTPIERKFISFVGLFASVVSSSFIVSCDVLFWFQRQALASCMSCMCRHCTGISSGDRERESRYI